MSTSACSVTFWLNAFLPRDIFGQTTILRDGPHAGWTAISGSHCCLTDQRNFSSDPRAESRMHSQVTINFTNATPAMTQSHRCDFTTECNCNDGEVRCQKHADTTCMSFTLLSIEPTVLVRMDCMTSNPCSSSPWAFGDIHYKGLIEFNREARSIAIELMIGLFPAFEGYASINGGPGTTLFHHVPPAGMTVVRAPGGANRLIRSRLEDRNGDGIFELPSTDR